MSGDLEQARKAVVRVGDGRGFIVETGNAKLPRRLVITAAHCLPFFPEPNPAGYLEERTYGSLLGPIGGDCTVAAELLFADAVGDIAVLCEPDGQVLHEQWEAYGLLTDDLGPIKVADAEGQAFVLNLEGAWLPCTVEHGGRHMLSLSDVPGGVQRGMSGSPVISGAGAVMGLISTGTFGDPRLIEMLPPWLLRDLGVT